MLEPLSEGFRHLHDAQLAIGSAAPRLHVGTFPFLASEVLTPRIDALRQRQPDAEIRFFTHTGLERLTETDPALRLDVVVTYGPADGRFPGLVGHKLADVSVLPVLAADAPAPRSVDELLARPLIHVIGPFQGWARSCALHAPGTELPTFAMETVSFHAAMLAVERGDGVRLGVLPQLRPWLRASRVQALTSFELPVEEQAAFAVCAPHQADRAEVRQFVEWLTDQLAEDAA